MNGHHNSLCPYIFQGSLLNSFIVSVKIKLVTKQTRKARPPPPIFYPFLKLVQINHTFFDNRDISFTSIACRWLSLGTPVSCSNKTDRHDIAELLLKVALNTTTFNPMLYIYLCI